MDTSNPAVFVNAELLPMYVNRKVRALVQVLKIEGETMKGLSTDDRELLIKPVPPFPLTKFVEVIGIADGNQSIRAETLNSFGDESIDMSIYNRVCLLANGEHKSLFI